MVLDNRTDDGQSNRNPDGDLDYQVFFDEGKSRLEGDETVVENNTDGNDNNEDVDDDEPNQAYF